MDNKRNNNAISFIRVISMLSVITSHVLVSNNIYDYSIFDFSRSAFLMISGILYSNKEIINKKDFLKRRAVKILLPVWIWSLFVSIMEIIFTCQLSTPLSSFIITLFNLQGLDSIFISKNYFSNRILASVAAFWFITLIFICYIILALIKNTKIDIWIKDNKKKFVSILIVIQVLLVLLLKIQCGYIFSFFIGYVFYANDEIDIKKVFLYFILIIMFGLLRINLRNCIDGTLFYNEVILPNFNTLAALFIVVFCLYIQNRFNIFDGLCNTRFYKVLESDSYYLYITHEFFLYGTFKVQNFTNNIIINLIIFIVLSFCFTKLLKKISIICQKFLLSLSKKGVSYEK